MSDLRKAAEMALAKLDHLWEIAVDERMGTDVLPEIKALREALAQPEQEPVDVVKVEHARRVELAEMYERGWNAALAKRKPVAWMYVNDDGECEQIEYGDPFDDPSVTPLYTAPPKREWVGLTPDEISELSEQAKKFCNDMFNTPDYDYFAGALWRAIEAKLKEKNT